MNRRIDTHDEENSSAEIDEDPRIAEILAQIVERQAKGESVTLEEYRRLYPEHADRLAVLWATVRLMARLRQPGDLDSTVTEPGDGWSLPPITVRLRTLGDFRVLREIGRGGMGIVYEAEQVSLRRRVALKVLPASTTLNHRQIERFQIEARAAACLHHPNIVPVHAVGSENGMHYFAMQLINGRTLSELIHGEGDPHVTAPSKSPDPSKTSTFRRAAELIIQAADAIEEAHRQGIVHRDIKPSNLLVDREDKLWVTDFGLARIQGDRDLTRTGETPGTPRYMSPEQVSGSRGVVDFRCDVYALGATLYELVTVRYAFPGDDVEVLRAIAHDDPAPPRKIDRRIPVDLETVILKALAKSPAERYDSARAMSEDLRNFLDGRPIRARRRTAWDHATKFALRNRSMVMSAVAFCILGVAALIGGLVWSNSWLKAHSRLLQAEIDRADRHAKEADRQRRISDLHLHDVQVRLAQQALDAGQHERVQDILDEIRPGPDGFDPRDFAWHYLRHQSRRVLTRIRSDNPGILEISLSTDGSTLLAYGKEGLDLWDLAKERIRWKFLVEARSIETGKSVDAPSALDTRPNVMTALNAVDPQSGRTIARIAAEPGGWINLGLLPGCKLWLDISNPASPPSCWLWDLVGHDPSTPKRYDFDPRHHYYYRLNASSFLVELDSSGRKIRDCRDGAIRFTIDPSDRRHIAGISRDGDFVILGGPGQGYQLQRTRGGDARPIQLPREPVNRPDDIPFRISDRGERAAARDQSGAVHLWEAATGRATTFRPGGTESGWVTDDMTFSPDGLKLSTLSQVPGRRSVIDLWDARTGRRHAEFPGRLAAYSNPIFAPDSRSLHVATGPNLLRWYFEPDPDGQPERHRDEAWSVAYRPDGDVFASGYDDGADDTIRICDARTGAVRRRWHAGMGTVAALEFSPDGQMLLSAHIGPRPNVRLWDVASGRLTRELSGHENAARTVAFSPDGETFASAGDDFAIRLWDSRTGKPKGLLSGHSAKVRSIAFMPDGRGLVSASNDRTARIWNVETARATRVLHHTQQLSAIAVHAGGASLSVADEDGKVTIWDTARGTHSMVLQGDPEELRSLAVTPNGRPLATAGASGKVQIWDIQTGQQILTLEGPRTQVNGLAFDPAGRDLASCSHDGEVRLWRSK